MHPIQFYTFSSLNYIRLHLTLAAVLPEPKTKTFIPAIGIPFNFTILKLNQLWIMLSFAWWLWSVPV